MRPACDVCCATPQKLYARADRLLCLDCYLATRENGKRSQRPLMKRWPCEGCDDGAMECDTGAGFCRRSPNGDFACAEYLTIDQLEVVAGQIAALVAGVENETVRRELAEGVVLGLANALYELGSGAAFDERELFRRCRVALKEAAA